MLTKQEYIEGSRQQLDLWGDHLASMERDVALRVEKGQAELRRRLDEVRREKRRLKNRLWRASAEAKEAWPETKEDLQEAFDTFRDNASRLFRTSRS